MASDDPEGLDEPAFMRIEAALARIEQSAQHVRNGERGGERVAATGTSVEFAERLDRAIARVRAALAVTPEMDAIHEAGALE